MFIAFEGVDGSGKTLLSKLMCNALNVHRFNDDGDEFVWTKEPTFGTEKADELNADVTKESQYSRELRFMEDRLRHQGMLSERVNVVCDRYIWSGIAYVKKFSPDALGFLTECYTYPRLFRQPDVHVLVDTPLEVCCERRQDVEMERLESLQRAYYETIRYIESPIVKVSAERSEEEANITVRNIMLVLFHLDKYAKGEEISDGWMENLTRTTLNLENAKRMLHWSESSMQA